MEKHPILVDLFREGDTLKPESRVNFGSLTTIHYSLCIKFLGQVTAASLLLLKSYLPDLRDSTQAPDASYRYAQRKNVPQNVPNLSERQMMPGLYPGGQYLQAQYQQQHYGQEPHEYGQEPYEIIHQHAIAHQGNTAKPLTTHKAAQDENQSEGLNIEPTDDDRASVCASSDDESIFSDNDSIASSQSSMSELHFSALSQLVDLLLHHNELRPLYTLAISKFAPEKFQRNFRRLLLHYGRNLQKEASTPLEMQAAQFVRR